MKIYVPVKPEEKVHACWDCTHYFNSWRLALTSGQPLCLNSAPLVPQDVVTGGRSKIDIALITDCRTERSEKGNCGAEGKNWKDNSPYDEGGW
jgi:hypothetical protein